MVSFEVSFHVRGFRLRRLAQSSVCDDSVARICGRGTLGRFTGCLCTFWSETWFYVRGARDRMVLEGRNVSLRGRCKESDTVWKSWQAQYFADVAKPLAGVRHSIYVTGAGNPHHGCYVLRSEGSIPEKGCFFGTWTEDQFAWPAQHFVWPRVMISWQAQYFWNMFPFSWKSRRKRSFWKSVSSVFEEVSQKALVLEVRIFSFQGSLAENNPSQKTLVLEVRIFSFRGSLAENNPSGAPDLQFSGKSRRKRSFWSSMQIFSFRGSLAENAKSGSSVFGKSLTKRSVWSSGFSVFEEGSHKTLLLEARVFNFRGGLAELARLQNPDASCKDPRTQRSCDRDLAEVLIQRSCTSAPTGFWYKILLQRSCTSAPTGSWSWYKWSKGSSHRDPETEILHKLSHRILIQWSKTIPIQWPRPVVF